MFSRDNAPVNQAMLGELTRFLTYRGPDGCELWSQGGVGLGHAMLRTTWEAAADSQPRSLDGNIWIVADARIDCRAELKAKLAEAGCRFDRDVTDSELILHSYTAWREDCVKNLRGDFAFAIWDAGSRTMFCARDHFGVKPFYYSSIGALFLFSNTLNAVRLHPAVSGVLNEAAIADFLLFGLNCDVATTTYRDVQRLPAAHFLTVSADGLRKQRYWSAPTDGRVRYQDEKQYVEHFDAVLKAAVCDRLRADRVGILLSGGLDSSSVAAVARELSPVSGGSTQLRAYTIVYEKLFNDLDGANAQVAADFLQIPLDRLAVDDLPLFDRWNAAEFAWPEPVDDPLSAGLFDQFKMIAENCRAVLSGEGVDNLMHFEMWPYARDLAKHDEWARLFTEVPSYAAMRGIPWTGIRRRIKGIFRRDPRTPTFPKWIDPDFARRTNSEARWRERNNFAMSERHPILPSGHASLSLPHWSRMFEHENSGISRQPVEVRHPFIDLRVVDFLLALPPFPWSFKKKLLRDVMAGRLPEAIRTRPKTSLPINPTESMLDRPEAEWVNSVKWSDETACYVNTAMAAAMLRERKAGEASANIRPLCLNLWLQSVRIVRYNLSAEVRNE
jgi:asparagine synthase (glutamine-hydrolysing)